MVEIEVTAPATGGLDVVALSAAGRPDLEAANRPITDSQLNSR